MNSPALASTPEAVLPPAPATNNLAQLAQHMALLQSSVDQFQKRAEAAEQETAAVKKQLQQALVSKPTEQFAPEAPTGDPLVPTEDPTHILQQTDQEIVWSLKHGSHLLITGPTGSGKTVPVVQACARTKRRMQRVCFDGETTSADLIGRRDAVDGKTVWTDGVLPNAMLHGHVLLVDEIDRADESSRAALFSALDSGTMFLPVSGKHIRAVPGFQLIACCNSVGDTTGAYTGTQPVDAAFLGRWRDVIRVEYPSKQIETQMLMKISGMKPTGADKIADLLLAMRKAATDGHLPGPYSIRQSKRIAELFVLYRLEQDAAKQTANPTEALTKALCRAVYDRETADARRVMAEIIQKICAIAMPA